MESWNLELQHARRDGCTDELHVTLTMGSACTEEAPSGGPPIEEVIDTMQRALIKDDEAAGAIMSAITRLSYQQLDIIQVSISDMCRLHEGEPWTCFGVRRSDNMQTPAREAGSQHCSVRRLNVLMAREKRDDDCNDAMPPHRWAAMCRHAWTSMAFIYWLTLSTPPPTTPRIHLPGTQYPGDSW